MITAIEQEDEEPEHTIHPDPRTDAVCLGDDDEPSVYQGMAAHYNKGRYRHMNWDYTDQKLFWESRSR
jgi:hypothetical protein